MVSDLRKKNSNTKLPERQDFHNRMVNDLRDKKNSDNRTVNALR